MFLSKRKTLFAIIAIVGAATIAEIFLLHRIRTALAAGTVGASDGCSCAPTIVGAPLQYWHNAGLIAGSVFLFGLVIGAGYLFITIFKTRFFIKNLKRNIVPQEYQFGRLTEKLNLANKLLVFRSESREAFTFGFIRPTIAISSHCVATLNQEELAAVLQHEASHVRFRDPLIFLILDALKISFFYIPLIKSLVQYYKTLTEINADTHIANTAALGRAILHMADGEHERLGVCASFASALKIRIDRILHNSTLPQFAPKAPVVFFSIFIFTAIFFGINPRPPSREFSEQACIRQQTPCVQRGYGQRDGYFTPH